MGDFEERSTDAQLQFESRYDKLVSGAAKILPSGVGDCVKHLGLADAYELEEDAIVFTKKETYPRADSEEITISFHLLYDNPTKRVYIQFNPTKVKVPGKKGKKKNVFVGYSETKAREIATAIEGCLRDVPRSFARNVAAFNTVSRGVKKPKNTNNPATQAMLMPDILSVVTGYLAPTRSRRNAPRNALRNLAEAHYNANPNLKAVRMGWTKGKSESTNTTRKNKSNEPKGNKGPRGAGGNEPD